MAARESLGGRPGGEHATRSLARLPPTTRGATLPGKDGYATTRQGSRTTAIAILMSEHGSRALGRGMLQRSTAPRVLRWSRAAAALAAGARRSPQPSRSRVAADLRQQRRSDGYGLDEAFDAAPNLRPEQWRHRYASIFLGGFIFGVYVASSPCDLRVGS